MLRILLAGFLLLNVFPVWAQCGLVLGPITESSMQVRINRTVVPAYTVQGTTCVFVGDLEKCGFEVSRDDNYRVIIGLTDSTEPATAPAELQLSTEKVKGDVTYPRWRLFISNRQIPAYEYKGRVLMQLLDLVVLGTLDIDLENKRISFTPGEPWEDSYGLVFNFNKPTEYNPDIARDSPNTWRWEYVYVKDLFGDRELAISALPLSYEDEDPVWLVAQLLVEKSVRKATCSQVSPILPNQETLSGNIIAKVPNQILLDSCSEVLDVQPGVAITDEAGTSISYTYVKVGQEVTVHIEPGTNKVWAITIIASSESAPNISRQDSAVALSGLTVESMHDEWVMNPQRATTYAYIESPRIAAYLCSVMDAQIAVVVESLNKTEKQTEAARKEALRKNGNKPLEITYYYLEYNLLDIPVAYTRVFNLTSKMVDAFELDLLCYDTFDRPVKGFVNGNRQTMLYQGPLPSLYEITTFITLYGRDTTTKIHPILKRVHFTDGTVWKAD